MAGTYADLFSGATYGTFNGPLYGSGPSTTAVGYFESRQEPHAVIGGEPPTQSRAEHSTARRAELGLLSAQEPRTLRRGERQ